jgi:hypothetical protein
MKGGPFRELFVEISREAFEIAKAIGEEAVARADAANMLQAPAPAQKLVQSFDFEWLGSRIAPRYGWAFVENRNNPIGDGISWIVRLRCGHHHVIAFPRRLQAMARGTETFEFLLDHIDKHEHERSCFCVQHKVFCASCSRDITDATSVEHTPMWRDGVPSVLTTCADSGCVTWARALQHHEREARLYR